MVGYRISKCMKVFAYSYDLYTSQGKSKNESFTESTKIFRTCYPFTKLSTKDWENIHNTFPKLDDPKGIFLLALMFPAKQVINCFKSPDYFKNLIKAYIKRHA